MKLYGKYFNKHKIPFLTAILCVSLEALCDLMGPTLMSQIVRGGIEQGNLAAVRYWGTLMLLVTIVGAGFAVVRNNLASSVSQKMGAELRSDLFEKIVSFSEISVDRMESGSLITRMTNDTSQIILFVNGIMRIFLKAPITGIGSIILATMLNARLSLIIYGVVLIVTILIYISMKLSYPRFHLLQKAIDRMNSYIQEYLMGIRLVKVFGTYADESRKFDDTNQGMMRKAVASQMVITVIAPILTLVIGIGTVSVLYVGSYFFSINAADAGDITAFTIYMSQILFSLIMITNVFSMFVRTKASTARIKEILECEEDYGKGQQKRSLSGGITFDNVTFAYPNGSNTPVISNLSFSVEQGESLAIIGPTGSGKSTIVWLLLHFYEVNSGRILLDQYDLKQLGVDELRNNIAFVPQKPALFSGSIADNLRWGDKEASADTLQEVLNRAQADFVNQMPEGTESILGSGGVNLSGGQKQRISIARGMVKKAPIMILDDVTSALDAITEARIQEKLQNKDKKQTVITITQRCGTAMFADKILVIEQGNRVGFGTHDELMEQCQVYQDIYQTQISGIKGV